MKILVTLAFAFLLSLGVISAEEIDFESRDYLVVHAAGFLVAHKPVVSGDILRFSPQQLLDSKPALIWFEERETTGGKKRKVVLPLAEGNFKLERTYKNEFSKFNCYMFLSEGEGMKIRFDVNYDSNMFITIESKGIVSGVISLQKITKEANKAEMATPRKPSDQIGS